MESKTPNTDRAPLRLASNPEERLHQQQPQHLPIQRQFVNFTFYRVRPEWRLLDRDVKERGRQEFAKVVESFTRDLLINTYSLVGLRTNA